MIIETFRNEMKLENVESLETILKIMKREDDDGWERRRRLVKQ